MFGGFTQYNNESYKQLIWKMCPEILETSAHIDTSISNKDKISRFHYTSAMTRLLGPKAHLYTKKEGAERVMISDWRVHQYTREIRMIRRRHKIGLLEAAEKTEGLLYGPGIDDSI